MAVSISTIWEVRTTGNDANGGGFVAGSGGTDYSQQDSAQATGTVTSASTTVTATTGIFTLAMVGNYITDGTTWVNITGFTNSTVVTVDAAPSWTAASIKVGGALATLNKVSALMVGGNIVWARGTGFTSTSGLTFANFGVSFTALIGYGSIRGDGVNAKLTLQTNSSLIGITLSQSMYCFYMTVDCASLTGSTAFSGTVLTAISNCTAMNFNTAGFDSIQTVVSCRATGGGSSSVGFSKAALVFACTADSNSGDGFSVNTGSITRCLASNNSGNGIIAAGNGGWSILGCTCYNNLNGILLNIGYATPVTVMNCILVNNSNYGINCNQSMPPLLVLDYNAYYNNTSGQSTGISNSGGALVVPVYTYQAQITLTGDPFTNAAGGDFTLNNTAGAGAACRAAGFPGALPSGGTGYLDIGALQHQDSGGSTIQVFQNSVNITNSISVNPY